MVHSTDIVELELKSKKFSLSVKKKEAVEQPEPVYAQVRGLALLSFCECLAQIVSGLVTTLRLAACLPTLMLSSQTARVSVYAQARGSTDYMLYRREGLE